MQGEERGAGGRAIFSPSPIHLDVSEEAEMAKNVARMLAATALPSSVFPVPARQPSHQLSLVRGFRVGEECGADVGGNRLAQQRLPRPCSPPQTASQAGWEP